MRLALLLSLSLILSCNDSYRELPLYGRSEIIKKETENGTIYDTIPHTVEEFHFINQDSIIISNNTFKNSIYVTDFFFTTCPTICPLMKNNMMKVYDEYVNNSNIPDELKLLGVHKGSTIKLGKYEFIYEE